MKKLILSLALIGASFGGFAADKAKCTAKTQAGANCSRTAAKDDVKCFQHSDKAVRCGANTKAGAACKVVVKVAGSKCHNHKQEGAK